MDFVIKLNKRFIHRHAIISDNRARDLLPCTTSVEKARVWRRKRDAETAVRAIRRQGWGGPDADVTLHRIEDLPPKPKKSAAQKAGAVIQVNRGTTEKPETAYVAFGYELMFPTKIWEAEVYPSVTAARTALREMKKEYPGFGTVWKTKVLQLVVKET